VTEAQMRELVSATFATGWRAARPDVGFALDNETAELPPVGADSFALLTIMLTGARQMTTGGRGIRRVQRAGWLQVKLWTPANTGAAGAAGLAGTVLNLLEMVDMPSPITGDEPVNTQAEMASPGRHAAGGEDGRWYMTLVRIPFTYAETK